MKKAERQSFIPQGYELIAMDERVGFEVYASTKEPLVAMGFSGKRSKPNWHIRFTSEQTKHKKISDSLANLLNHEETKAKRRQARLAEHDVAVGDVFSCSWGWEQTNVEYFEVTALVGKNSCKARKIRQARESTGLDTGECAPLLGHYLDEEKTYRINCAFNEPEIRIYSFANATRIKPIAVLGDKKIFQTANWSSYA